jgi:hypothetical protein
LRAEGFSCSLDVLYGGLEISKLQFFIKKNFILFFSCNFFPIFWSSKPWIRIRIGIQPRMLDPDPKHCLSEIWYHQTTTTPVHALNDMRSINFGPKTYTDIIVSPLGSSTRLIIACRLPAKNAIYNRAEASSRRHNNAEKWQGGPFMNYRKSDEKIWLPYPFV